MELLQNEYFLESNEILSFLKHERLNGDLTISDEQQIFYVESLNSTRLAVVTFASAIAAWHYTGWFTNNKLFKAVAIPFSVAFFIHQTEGWRVRNLRNDLKNYHPELNTKLEWARQKGIGAREMEHSIEQYVLQENSERYNVLIKLYEREGKLLASENTDLQSKRKLFNQEWKRLSFFDRVQLNFERIRGGDLRASLIVKKQANDTKITSSSSNFAISRLQNLNSQLDEDLAILSPIQEDN
eukprot:TRINITY_DN1627_c1_g1_i1.p1 TRINITY_DN1627_c1_g1~~TRINITY_DN1627_c1_g1_i1.p1  ORF type:complete len:241 (-),score=98.81 TRINITY_DN1627_c1_g1_i1:112-834(-)